VKQYFALINFSHVVTIHMTNEWDSVWLISDEGAEVCTDCCNH